MTHDGPHKLSTLEFRTSCPTHDTTAVKYSYNSQRVTMGRDVVVMEKGVEFGVLTVYTTLHLQPAFNLVFYSTSNSI